MKLFRCQSCGQVLHFENTRCERCGHQLGFLPNRLTLSALEPDAQEGAFGALAEPGSRWRYCENATHAACNWLVSADSADRFCASCRQNRVVPDLSNPTHLLAWQRFEFAKHRLTYTLLKLQLPIETRAERPETGLCWDVLADSPAEGTKILTGHENGLITLALVEGDDVERERRRAQMGEPYRTLLGHVRHEVGHYFWDRLVLEGGQLDACRAVFGDDTEDYEAALRRHYAEGAPADWRERFVSAYATTHPWEDFAESWAHYLHIIDTLEMASEFGLSVEPRADRTGLLSAAIDIDPYAVQEVGALIESWLPLTQAVNSLNRCMGAADLYPFVLSPAVIEKLGYIHALVHAAR